MNSRTLSTLAIVGFVLLGLACMGLRYQARQQAQIAREDSHWRLTYEVRFDADPIRPDTSPPEVRLALPFATRHCEVLKETWHLKDPHLQERVVIGATTRTRELVLTASQPQEYNVSAEFELRLSPRPISGRQPTLENLTGDARVRFLREERDGSIPVRAPEVEAVVRLAPDEGETRWDRILWIFDFCRNIDSRPESASDSVREALANRVGTPLARARAMVALCRRMRIPARLVAGFEIREDANAQPRVWVEVFESQMWIPFDPQFGYSQYLPMNYLPVRRGGDQVVSWIGASNVGTKFTITRLRPGQRIVSSEIRHPVQVFNLQRLPVPMHQIMALLLLLPFGALITAFMRNVIGVQTFGTFAPALLALSFIYANWETGLAILIIVVTVGLFGRSLLERLRLLMVPRLSIVLTTVILCVVFSISLLHYLLPTISTEAVLLPMVILTILIERFHVTVEEDGLVFAMQLAVGTAIVSAFCYAILRWEDVGQFVLIYPEAHFFTIAAFIALGRYAGYRLTELWRFRDLVEPSETPR